MMQNLFVKKATDDLVWKPLYFLSKRSEPSRVELQSLTDWSKLLQVCQDAGSSYGYEFGRLENFEKLEAVAPGINKFSIKLLHGKKLAMPDENACKQTARLNYCLFRARRYQVHDKLDGALFTKEHYVRSLWKALLKARDVDEEWEVVRRFGTARYWSYQDNLKNRRAARKRLEDVRKFREKCNGDFRLAKQLIGAGYGSAS